MKNIFLDAALEYEERGWSVIPLEPKGKKPLVPWEKYQKERASREQITRWWIDSPLANVGVVTGEVSGIVVIDIDGDNARKIFKDTFPGDFSETPTVRTGKGWHLYFQHPGRLIPNRTGVLPGVDVRGDGGYVVAPPSIHPNKREYKWR